jgi:protein-disulfide isomerase
MKGKDSMVLSIIIIASALIISGSIFIVGENIGGKIAAKATGKVVLDAPQKKETAKKPNIVKASPGEKETRMEKLVENAASTAGNPNAPIVLVEYSDYQCPFCRKWFNDVKRQLDKEYIETGKVFFVYKDFPLSFHPMAKSYAEAARCAGEQGKYWEMHDKIFEEQSKLGQGTILNISLDDIKLWGKELNLNSSEFDSCLSSGKYSNIIQENFNEGSTLGVNGTPSFIIGKRNSQGKLIVGAQPFSVFKSAIDSLLN